MPETNLDFITALLTLIDDKSSCSYDEYVAKRKQLFEEYQDSVFEIIMNYLSNLDLIEHGFSIYGSWIMDQNFLEDCQKNLIWRRDNE